MSRKCKSPVPVNPKLPANFDCTPNDSRPRSHYRWLHRPYVQLCDFYDLPPDYHAAFLRAWPEGTRYDVRCLDGGAWDRSTCWGSFKTLEEAIQCALNRRALEAIETAGGR